MSFNSVKKFEQEVADFFGAKYAVATDCCTHAIELCLRVLKTYPLFPKKLFLPTRTYISVPFTLHKLEIPFYWNSADEEYSNWSEYYYIGNTPVIDAAVYWKKGGYIPDSFMCLSFQFQKHLSLGRGGMILTDNLEFAKILKKMSYDGRDPDIPWRHQNISIIGYHYYMTPETAQLGLDKLDEAINTKPRKWEVTDWPDVSRMGVFCPSSAPVATQREVQKDIWKNEVRKHYGEKDLKSLKVTEMHGYTYGDPESSVNCDSDGIELGNYKKILQDFLLPYVNKDCIALEIGCLSGKWTRFLLDAKKVICVDIIKDGYEIFMEVFNPKNTEFYLTEGDELKGIEDKSVDLIFSMDSLCRCDRLTIGNYISEIFRVLKPNGKICVHLPCLASEGSVKLGFTPVELEALQEYCEKHVPDNYNIALDLITIGHGVLLRGKPIEKEVK